MEYGSRWPEPYPHYSSAPAPAPLPLPLPHHYPAPPASIHQPYPHLTSSSYYQANPNPNPNPNHILPPPNHNHILPPPNTIFPPYDTANAGILHSPPPANPYAPHGGYSNPPLGPTPLSHYYGARAGAGDPHGFSVKEAIRQYGVDPVGYSDHYVPAPPRPSDGLPAYGPPSALTPHWKSQSYSVGAKRAPKKTTKVVQSAYCEVCKVDCTTQDVLNNHKQGKRHKKNLQKLQESITPKTPKAPVTANAVEAKESAGNSKGKAVIGEKKKRKEAPQATEEDLETKKRKMLESGATPDGVRVCTICNVVVNSQKVYDFHIAGQKHIAMVKQQQEVAAS